VGVQLVNKEGVQIELANDGVYVNRINLFGGVYELLTIEIE